MIAGVLEYQHSGNGFAVELEKLAWRRSVKSLNVNFCAQELSMGG